MKRLLLAASALAVIAAPMAASAQPGERHGGRGGRDRGGDPTQTQQSSDPGDRGGGGGDRQRDPGSNQGRGGGRQEQPQTVAPQGGGETDAGARRAADERQRSEQRNRPDSQGQPGWQGRGGRDNGVDPRNLSQGDDRGGRFDGRGADGRGAERRGIEGRNPDGAFNRGDGRNDNRNDGRFDGRSDRRGDDRNDGRFDGRNGWNGRDGDRRGGFDRGRRGPPQYQYRGRSFSAHRAPAYRWAPGYSYRRWSIGSILPQLLFRQEYIVRDFYAYDLPPPPPGTYYLRVDADLYVVTWRGGRVVDVIYDVFYDDYGYGY